MIPEDLHYTTDHEWVRSEPSGNLRVGITHYAQEALGDIVFVQLPEMGSGLEAGQPCGEVESTKSVSDVYAPVAGTVVAVNDSLDAAPELLNSDPYGNGWIYEVEPREPGALGALLTAEAYAQSIGH